MNSPIGVPVPTSVSILFSLDVSMGSLRPCVADPHELYHASDVSCTVGRNTGGASEPARTGLSTSSENAYHQVSTGCPGMPDHIWGDIKNATQTDTSRFRGHSRLDACRASLRAAVATQGPEPFRRARHRQWRARCL